MFVSCNGVLVADLFGGLPIGHFVSMCVCVLVCL